MLDIRGLWRRHKRKVLISLGLVGSGYVFYKLYDAHRRSIRELEKQLEDERQFNELVKTQLQNHFENIQRVSDTTTLPCAMHFLRSRIAEELDHSYLTEKLMQAKGQSSSLSPKEKLELWERLKLLSFTRTTASLWAMTTLCLYVRVQVNILGRHLYLETARGLGSHDSLDEAESFSQHGHQDFLATADYLSTYGIGSLISQMQNAAHEVLKEKQLKDPFSTADLCDTIIQIVKSFMSTEEPNYWINYLLPENATAYKQLTAMSSNAFDGNSMRMDISKLEQLMVETRAVLSSSDFRNILEISLKKVVDVLIEDMPVHFGESISSGLPLAKLLPRVAQLGPLFLEDPTNNKFVQIIRALPEVELFYTLLYSNMPPPSFDMSSEH